MEIRPITFREANKFVAKYHRHNTPVIGSKFCIAVYDNGAIHGVAICGRPVSRHLDDGLTLEINRVCTDGLANACSKLYGACVRIAKDMGYHKIITYILESEYGASVRAANFIFDGKAGGIKWTGTRDKISLFPELEKRPKEMKKRYIKILK